MNEINVKVLIGAGVIMATEAYVCGKAIKVLIKESKAHLHLMRKYSDLECKLKEYEIKYGKLEEV